MTDFKNSTGNKSTDDNLTDDKIDIQHQLDTQGLICPEPVMMLHRAVRQADAGDAIEVLATDPATTRDIPNFCRHLGHTLLEQSQSELTHNPTGDSQNNDKLYRYVIQKKKA